MTLDEVKQRAAQAKISPLKLRGQNFLLNDAVPEAMVKAAGVKKGDAVLEIGPGLGVLTQVLVKAGAQVTAVEVDPAIADYIRKEYPQIRVVEGDARDAVFQKIAQQYARRFKIIANIPYNITSDLFWKVIEGRESLESVTLLVQKEVAERLTAKEGMNQLALAAAIIGEAQIMMQVPRADFWPSPKVDSAVLHLAILPTPRVQNPDKMLAWSKNAFAAPRKKLSSTLGDLAYSAAKLTGNERPEVVTAEQWIKLWKAEKE